MKIHALARSPHLMEHIHAVWKHLPDELRGEQVVDELHPRIRGHLAADDLVMVASYLDIAGAEHHRVIYVEHGAGQSYVGGNPDARDYYHGGKHPENVVGYIGPRQDVIDAWGRPGFAAGAPICDDYQLFPEPVRNSLDSSTAKVAVITFHWNGAPGWMVGVPEAGTAFDHYEMDMKRIIEALWGQGYVVWGHRHPRFDHLRGYWNRVHDIYECTAEEMRRHASLLICDNSSVMYEMLYLWRDVIALNAPWYRRDVEHGLRFWKAAPSPQAEDADDLIEWIERPIRDMFNIAVNEYVYGKAHSDGQDGFRAATWLTMFASTL